MEQLYIEALLIHWHTGLKFSSENRNPQIPEIGQKNWPIHPSSAASLTSVIPAFQKAAFRCGWNRKPINWTSEKLSALSDVIYTVSHG